MKTEKTNPPPPFKPKRSLGQNFLTSPVVPRWMCEAAELVPGQTVLEIGPGTGSLTRELLQRQANVIAIEADERAVSYLTEHFAPAIATKQLKLHHGDVRALDLASLGLDDQRFVVVANIPYYLSGLILRQMLESTIQPHALILLLQKELVTRIAREPKSSILSLSVRAFGDPYYVRTVSRGHFAPAPMVDSAILAVRNINHERLKGVGSKNFFRLLHTGLGKKRKQLIGNLKTDHDRAELAGHFADLGIPLTARGEDLPLSGWIALAKLLFKPTD